MNYFREKFVLDPRKILSPYFSEPVVYNLDMPPESFCWEEIKIIYKTYFTSGIIPIKSMVKTVGNNDREQFAAIYFMLCCQRSFPVIDPEELLDKIERYSNWNKLIRTLCNSIHSHSSTK